MLKIIEKYPYGAIGVTATAGAIGFVAAGPVGSLVLGSGTFVGLALAGRFL